MNFLPLESCPRLAPATLAALCLLLAAACSDPVPPGPDDGGTQDDAEVKDLVSPDLAVVDLTPAPDKDPCGPGTKLCGKVCVNTSSDHNNCGKCDTKCKLGQVCSSGKCTLSCQSWLTDCSGSCANLMTDHYNCGACANKCKAGQICLAGKCTLSCQSGLTDCSGTCVNLQTDHYNCGACATKCSAGQLCSSGKCAISCQSGLTDCSGDCVNLQSDLANCGACATKCSAGQLCSAGKCALSCQSGLTDCSGTCVNLMTDHYNCGTCATTCSAGQLCASGKCALSCQSGLTDCSGTCVNLMTDHYNCGACASKCSAGQLCSSGKCALSCQSGLTDCSGACVDLQTSASNCGACATTCSAGQLCAGGKCTTPCKAGYTDCSGKCVDLTADTNNCGACGATCGAGVLCLKGKCVTGSSCATILAAYPSSKDGVYTIRPSAAGLSLKVYCDMTSHHGGWILLAKIGTAYPHKSKGPFSSDRNTANLLDATAPASGLFAHWKASRFDAFNSNWTIRSQVDAHNTGKHYQYTFFRPKAGATVLSSTAAGKNWNGATTASKLLHLTMSTTTGLSNTTWLPVEKWDVCCGHSFYMLGYRLAKYGSGQQCLSKGQTAYCHAPAGGIITENNAAISGTYTAAFGYGDGVTHAHKRRAYYWIKEVNKSGTP